MSVPDRAGHESTRGESSRQRQETETTTQDPHYPPRQPPSPSPVTYRYLLPAPDLVTKSLPTVTNPRSTNQNLKSQARQGRLMAWAILKSFRRTQICLEGESRLEHRETSALPRNEICKRTRLFARDVRECTSFLCGALPMQVSIPLHAWSARTHT